MNGVTCVLNNSEMLMLVHKKGCNSDAQVIIELREYKISMCKESYLFINVCIQYNLSDNVTWYKEDIKKIKSMSIS